MQHMLTVLALALLLQIVTLLITCYHANTSQLKQAKLTWQIDRTFKNSSVFKDVMHDRKELSKFSLGIRGGKGLPHLTEMYTTFQYWSVREGEGGIEKLVPFDLFNKD